ncbi:MAG: hypothetical protein ACD_20C00179G0003 [uncultured bacterium]|nr:MAG: hypothetical protein ACD_20C00179G0003 [uncultured bacterium]HBH17441.1 hypothetical protein [Cyanobacteria bacterium UBA9579]
MSQGMFTAISGITTNQARLDVIADNIANMNTVGFKSSMVNFENVYVKTLSSGTAPGSNIGGTNPLQVGLGSTISEISRNFSSGTVQTTGNTNDLNIQGSGFFTLTDSEGSLLLTRAGNFKPDSDGYLVNPGGLKVLGTADVSSTTGSSTPIKIPQSLNLATTSATMTGTELLLNSSNVKITEGTFTVTVGATPYTITIDSSSTLNSVATAINTAAGAGTASVAGGSLVLTSNPADISVASNTSNFADVTGLSTATDTGVAPAHIYTSNVLTANSATIAPPDNTSSTSKLTSFSVGKDGSIEAVYANGDKISVTGNPTRELIYTTSTGYRIIGAGIAVSANAVSPQELQVQMANVTNPNGLVAKSGNTFTVGPNAGYASFAVGLSGGIGTINSGGLESSNIDLPTEFANMIVAQRGIEANSRTFDTINQVMRQLVMMGR